MSDKEPTHHITHTPSRTRAVLSLTPGVAANMADDTSARQDGARTHVAIAFKHTRPLNRASDMSRHHIDFDDLDIQPIVRGEEPGEPPIRMDPGGDPQGCDECPSCEQDFHERCKNNCPQAHGW